MDSVVAESVSAGVEAEDDGAGLERAQLGQVGHVEVNTVDRAQRARAGRCCCARPGFTRTPSCVNC